MLHAQKVLNFEILKTAKLVPREMLDLLGRSLPAQFASYAMAALFINLYARRCPRGLNKMMIIINIYNIRQIGQTRFYDSSWKRIGKQANDNRIDDLIKLLDTSWKTKTNKDEIKIYLKK